MAGLAWTTEPVLLVLFALAVYRLTRLVVSDVITARPREALIVRGPGWLGELLGCPWCVSVWLAAGWAGLACLLPVRVSALLAFVLAASALAGLLSSRE